MEVQVSVGRLVKQLQLRRKQLKARRAAELKAFERAFERWRLDLAKYLEINARACAMKITRKNIGHRYYGRRWQEMIFDGAPKPPPYPSDEMIRKIDAKLRQLALTDQKRVKLYTSDYEEIFNDYVESDD